MLSQALKYIVLKPLLKTPKTATLITGTLKTHHFRDRLFCQAEPSRFLCLSNSPISRTSKTQNTEKIFPLNFGDLVCFNSFPLQFQEEESKEMPLYDCMLLLKPHVKKEALMDLVARVGKHVYSRNGVLTDMKSFGHVQLGYGIKKLDGRYYQGQLMQMTMMATPNLNKELHYLNKEDRLLRWLLIKHRDAQFGLEFLSEEDAKNELRQFPRSSIYDEEDVDEDDSDDDDDDDEYDRVQEGLEDH